MFIRLSFSQEVVTHNLNGEGRKLLTLEKATKILVIFQKSFIFKIVVQESVGGVAKVY